MPALPIVPHGLLVGGRPITCSVGVQAKCGATIGHAAPKGWSWLKGTHEYRCSGYNNSLHRGKRIMQRGTWVPPEEWMPAGTGLLRVQDAVDVLMMMPASPVRGTVRPVMVEGMRTGAYEIATEDCRTIPLDFLAFDVDRKMWCLMRGSVVEAEVRQIPKSTASKASAKALGSAVLSHGATGQPTHPTPESVVPMHDLTAAISLDNVPLRSLLEAIQRRLEGQPMSHVQALHLTVACQNEGLLQEASNVSPVPTVLAMPTAPTPIVAAPQFCAPVRPPYASALPQFAPATGVVLQVGPTIAQLSAQSTPVPSVVPAPERVEENDLSDFEALIGGIEDDCGTASGSMSSAVDALDDPQFASLDFHTLPHGGA